MKHLFTILFILTLLNVGTHHTLYKHAFTEELTQFERQTQDELTRLENEFHNYFANAYLTAYSLTRLTPTQQGDYAQLKFIFEHSIRSNPTFLQIRYIDATGQEKVRVERDVYGAPIKTVAENELQNKADRDYVKQGLTLSEYGHYWSDINLNREHGEIEYPLKPVRRIVKPVYSQGSLTGLIVINACPRKLQQQLTAHHSLIYLIDQQSHFTWHPDPSKNWTKDLNLPDRAHSLMNKPYAMARPVMQSDLTLVIDQTAEVEILKSTTASPYWVSALITQVILLLVANGLMQYLHQNNLQLRLNTKSDELESTHSLLLQHSRNALMGEMLAMIAHQWKQPLNVIKLNASFLRLQIEKNKSLSLTLPEIQLYSKALKTIDQMIDEQDETLTDFRDFYQPSKKMRPFKITKTFDSALQILNPLIKQHNIQLDVQLGRETLLGVESEFRNAITNLIKNAIDQHISNATKDPKIILQSERSDETLTIRICDNAGGIPLELLDTLFDAYVSTKSLNGTGLGLYMTRIIIERTFNGHITAYNENDGAVFQLSLNIKPKETQ